MATTEPKAQQAFEAILAVLESASAPLSCGEIIQKALDSGKLQGTRKEWEPTVQAKLFYEVSKAKNSPIHKPSTGRFALKNSPAASPQTSALSASESEDTAKLKEEIRALKEENAALKSLVKRYMT